MNYCAEFAQDASELDRIIENWARWAKGRLNRSKSRVGSLEGNYSTADWSEDENVPTVSQTSGSPIDQLAAERTEEAWRKLPKKLGQILKLEYIAKQHYKRTCRALHIRFNDYADLLADARMLLLLALDKSD